MSLIFGAIAGGILIALVLMSTGIDQAGRHRAMTYRSRRSRLIERMEALHRRLAALAARFEKGDRLEGSMVRDLEKLVGSFETIVTAFSRIPAFGTDASLLDSADFLVKDCEERLRQMEIQGGLRSRAVITRVAQLLASSLSGQRRPGERPPRGCYFCSRPFHEDLQGFSQVRVRVERDTLDVFSCAGCKDRLEETKKIKVLYFLNEGRPQHWSQVAGYVPSEAYWNLNRHRLQLVETEDET
ncbi:MAG: hypothetical protein RIQ81_1673 [Pseudomonadota bacterium]|jgi:hypothetical protein